MHRNGKGIYTEHAVLVHLDTLLFLQRTDTILRLGRFQTASARSGTGTLEAKVVQVWNR